MSRRLATKLQRLFAVPPTALPVDTTERRKSAQSVVEALAALDYPGFTHVKPGRRVNPAQLLLAALGTSDLEPRLTEALPWVVWQYASLDWDWLVPKAKLRDLRTASGSSTAPARQVADRHAQRVTADALAAVEQRLEPSRLGTRGYALP